MGDGFTRPHRSYIKLKYAGSKRYIPLWPTGRPMRKAFERAREAVEYREECLKRI